MPIVGSTGYVGVNVPIDTSEYRQIVPEVYSCRVPAAVKGW